MSSLFFEPKKGEGVFELHDGEEVYGNHPKWDMFCSLYSKWFHDPNYRYHRLDDEKISGPGAREWCLIKITKKMERWVRGETYETTRDIPAYTAGDGDDLILEKGNQLICTDAVGCGIFKVLNGDHRDCCINFSTELKLGDVVKVKQK